MKKDSREFFEVFRRSPQKEKTATWWLKRPAPPAAAGAGPEEKALAPPSSRTGPADSGVVLSLSRQAIVVLAVVLTGLLVLAFVWGDSFGKAKQARVANAPAAPQATVLDVAQPQPMKPPYYTLRVMGAAMDARRAQEIVDFLISRNYDAFLLGKGGSCTVNVGRFARKDTEDARALREQIYSLVYGNQRWFTSCYWYKVTGQER